VFPMSWDLQRSDIRGVDVTARYAARESGVGRLEPKEQ
jgi:hypothetical protein